MASRELILDGLAWAGIPEQVRVAKIAAQLVRELDTYTHAHTKARVKQAVRDTSPPYGRAKFISDAVTEEYRRQLTTYRKRRAIQQEWSDWQAWRASRATRLNLAYAAAFDRPPYQPARNYPPEIRADWDARDRWAKKEQDRDKGDECISLTHFDGHVVCLVLNTPHVATRSHKGEVVRTRLTYENYNAPINLVGAAMMLGGPKVQAALSIGKRVVTDWVGRRSLIHHEGQDYVHPHVEELPWRSYRLEARPTEWGSMHNHPVPTLILGDIVTDDHSPSREEDD